MGQRRMPRIYKPGDIVENIYTGEEFVVKRSFWQYYAGGDTSDFTVLFEPHGWNKSTNLRLVLEKPNP